MEKEKLMYSYYKSNGTVLGIMSHEWRVLLCKATNIGNKELYITHDELFAITAQSNTDGSHIGAYALKVEMDLGGYHSEKALKLVNKIAPKLNRWFMGGRSVMRALKALKIERAEYYDTVHSFVPRAYLKAGKADLWVKARQAGYTLKAA